MSRAPQRSVPAEAEAAPVVETRVHLQGSADSLQGALAALGADLVGKLCPSVQTDAPTHPLELSCCGNDHHSLVLSWVETLIYLLEERQVALADIQVQVGQAMSLSAQCQARPMQPGSLLAPKALDPASARAILTEEGQWRTECTLLMDGGSAS